jgi:hypothetical protein
MTPGWAILDPLTASAPRRNGPAPPHSGTETKLITAVIVGGAVSAGVIVIVDAVRGHSLVLFVLSEHL